jgi:hypothetical protein
MNRGIAARSASEAPGNEMFVLEKTLIMIVFSFEVEISSSTINPAQPPS